MTILSVNLNKVAMLRNQRDLTYPSVTGMARLAINAGASGITVHPRPDERHIRRTDVLELAEMLSADEYSHIEYNIEGYPTIEFMELVESVNPHQITLVPDDPDQKTSDHGWDIPNNHHLLTDVITHFDHLRSRIALFIDDDPAMAIPAKAIGADRVELYTGPYNRAFAQGQGDQALESFIETAHAMRDAGLELNAGHDLNLDNLPAFLKAIPFIKEVSIGHAITADALVMGMDGAVKAYVKTLNEAGV